MTVYDNNKYYMYMYILWHCIKLF